MHIIHGLIRASVALLLLIGPPLQVTAAGFPARPGNLDEAGWASLRQVVGGSIKQQVRLVGNPSGPGADGASDDQFGYSVAVTGDTAIIGAPGDTIGTTFKQGSAYVFTRSGATWSLQAKLTAADGGEYAQFGYAVALAGDTALVGAYGDDADKGSAYVFTRNGSNWNLQAKLTAADRAFDDEFGFAVALYGDTALVSAHQDDVSFSNQGSAYVFTRSGTNWSQQAKLTASDGAAFDAFGNAAALFDDTVLIGASQHDVDFAEQGSAYVFVRSGTSWSQQARLTSSDGAQGDFFGESVALSADTAIVGASLDDDAGDVDQGSVYVFTRSGAIWNEQARLVAADGLPFDRFGNAVAIDGDRILLGAFNTFERGSAYVFTRIGANWTQQSKLMPSDPWVPFFFANSVAMSGDTLLVGAYLGEFNHGSVFAYTGSGAIWNEQAKLTAGPGSAGDNFGFSVAVSGDTALVGAWKEDAWDQGAAYVFTRSGENWTLQEKLTAADGVNDQFGVSVALSGDTALVGAWVDDVDFVDQGSAYVFTRSGGDWSQQAKLTANDGAANDYFGFAVALSGDTALVSAIADDASRGSAYVYTRTGTAWSLQAKLAAADGEAGDAFGTAVALHQDTALIGAWRDDVGVVDQGSAYVFTRNGTSWGQHARLAASDGATEDAFGYSVALFGGTALVGAWGDDGDFTDQGSAYVYIRSGSNWTQQARLTASQASAADRFGTAVALSGDTALVGALNDDKDFPFQGTAYVYTRNGTNWSQHARLVAADAAAADGFGNAVALSGDTAVVGASWKNGLPPYGNPSEGSAYVITGLPAAPFGIFGDGFE